MKIPVVEVDKIMESAIPKAYIIFFSYKVKKSGTSINEAYDCGSQKNEVGRSKNEYKRVWELMSGINGNFIGWIDCPDIIRIT